MLNATLHQIPRLQYGGVFFVFYFFREGGPVGHKHNLYANRGPYFFRVGGPVGHEHNLRLRASICVGICGNNA